MVGVVVFDRVFDSNNVLVEVVVDIVDHRRQRGGFTTTGGAGDEEHPSRASTQGPDRLWKPDILETEQLGRNQTQNQRKIALLVEHRRSEAAFRSELETEVGPALLLEFLLAPVGSDRLHQGDGVFWFKNLGVKGSESTMKPQRRLPSDVQVKVAGASLDASFQQPVNVQGHKSSFQLIIRPDKGSDHAQDLKGRSILLLNCLNSMDYGKRPDFALVCNHVLQLGRLEHFFGCGYALGDLESSVFKQRPHTAGVGSATHL